MLVDIHTHTKTYSKCSNMSGDELAKAAIDAGLDGVVITEHNTYWPKEEHQNLCNRYPNLSIFSAIEITVAEKEDILVYGVKQKERLFAQMPLEQLVNIAKQDGAVLVLAHPYRYRDSVNEQVYAHPTQAVESHSLNIRSYMSSSIDALAKKLDMIKVAGSDAHGVSAVGIYGMRFDQKIESEQALAKAILQKRFTMYKNTSVIRALNKGMKERIAIAKKLITDGLSDREVSLKSNKAVSVSMAYAIRNGYDVLYE